MKPCSAFLDFCSSSLPASILSVQYVMILEQLLEVFHVLELWRVDPLLHGELGYKLACLQEARADLKHATAASQLIGV